MLLFILFVQQVLPAPPPTPLGPRTDAAVEDPGLRPAEEPPKEERKQPEGVQAETAAVASDTEDGGTVVNNSGDVESPEAGAGSGLRNRRTQFDSERKSKDKETNVLPTETGVLPTNSSSKYSFVALEQRKKDLLRKAKRFGLYYLYLAFVIGPLIDVCVVYSIGDM